MIDFMKGIRSAEDEQRYQDAIATHPNGVVLGFNKGRGGRITAHSARCKSIKYDVGKKGQAARGRKICFESLAEMNRWIEEQEEVNSAGINRFCPQCRRLACR